MGPHHVLLWVALARLTFGLQLQRRMPKVLNAWNQLAHRASEGVVEVGVRLHAL